MEEVLNMYKKIINNKNEMKDFGYRLAEILKNGDVLSLVGGMGAGKTTLTQFIGEGLDIKEYITSPTFSIVQSYQGKKEVNHIDLYRIEDARELESIDMDQYLYPEGITIIEWASRAPEYMPRNKMDIFIDSIDEEKREIRIEGKNNWEQKLIKELEV